MYLIYSLSLSLSLSHLPSLSRGVRGCQSRGAGSQKSAGHRRSTGRGWARSSMRSTMGCGARGLRWCSVRWWWDLHRGSESKERENERYRKRASERIKEKDSRVIRSFHLLSLTKIKLNASFRQI